MYVIFSLLKEKKNEKKTKKKRIEHSEIRGNVNCLGRHSFLKPEPEQF